MQHVSSTSTASLHVYSRSTVDFQYNRTNNTFYYPRAILGSVLEPPQKVRISLTTTRAERGSLLVVCPEQRLVRLLELEGSQLVAALLESRDDGSDQTVVKVR